MNSFKQNIYNKLLNSNTGIIPGTKNFYCIHILCDFEEDKEILYIGKAVLGIRKFYDKLEFSIPLKNSSYKKREFQGKEKIASILFFNIDEFENIKIFETYKEAEEYLKDHPNKEDYDF